MAQFAEHPAFAMSTFTWRPGSAIFLMISAGPWVFEELRVDAA